MIGRGDTPLFLKDFPPITDLTLALYAAASGDINLPHLDSASARAAGFENVFAQGMLIMAYMGRALSESVAAESIKTFSTRFVAITPLGARLTCRGDIVDMFEADGEHYVQLNLVMLDHQGQALLRGAATAAAKGLRQRN